MVNINIRRYLCFCWGEVANRLCVGEEYGTLYGKRSQVFM